MNNVGGAKKISMRTQELLNNKLHEYLKSLKCHSRAYIDQSSTVISMGEKPSFLVMGYTNLCKIKLNGFSTLCIGDKVSVKVLALFGTWQLGKEVASWQYSR